MNIRLIVSIGVIVTLISCISENRKKIMMAEEYLKEYPDCTNITINPDKALSILDGIDQNDINRNEFIRINILSSLAKYKLYKTYFLLPIDSCKSQLDIVCESDPYLYYVYFFLKASQLFSETKYPEAMKYAMKAFQLSIQNQDNYWIAKNSQIIGDILSRNCNWAEALIQDSITIDAFRKSGRIRDAKFALVDHFANISGNGNIEKAKELFIEYERKWINEKDTGLIIYSLSRHAYCLIHNGCTKEAENIFTVLRQYGNPIGFKSEYYFALLLIAYTHNDSLKAKEYLDKIEKEEDDDIGEMRFLIAKSNYLKMEGQYKEALAVSDSINKLDNSIISKLLTQSVTAAQRDFYDEMAQEEALEAKRNRMIILFVSIGAIFVIILGWLYFRYRLKLKNLEIQNKINKIYNLSQDLDQLSSEKTGLLESVHNQEDQLNKITSELKLNLNNIEKMKEEIQHKEAELLTLSESLNSLSEESDDQYDSEALRQELEKLQIKEKENSRKIRELFKSRLEFFNKFSNIYLTKKDSPRVKKSLIEDFENMLTEMKKGIKAGQVEQQVNHFLNDIIAELREKCDTLSEEDLLVTSLIYAGYMPRYISEVCGYSSKYFYVKRTRIIEKILKSMPEQDASQYIEMIKKI